MNKPKSATKTSKSAKAKAKNLKVRSNVKAGGFSLNRCAILRRKV